MIPFLEKKCNRPILFKISSNLMLHLLASFLLEDYDALYYIIDELLVLVCGVSEVTESDGWHETPAEPGDHTQTIHL